MLAAVVMSVGCGHRVAERVPALGLAAESTGVLAYTHELSAAHMPNYLDDASAQSPDRKLALELTYDVDYRSHPTGYFGLVLTNRATGSSRPLLSLWEAHPMSGVSVAAAWSTDSNAIRLQGSTRGFRRSNLHFERFDLVYVVNIDQFFGLAAGVNPNAQVSAAPSN